MKTEEIIEMRCMDCRFFENSEEPEDSNFGYCVRYPPKPKEKDKSDTTNGISVYQTGTWPCVLGKEWWCGEFSRKNKTTEYPHLSQFGFGIRTRRALESLGIKTVEELLLCPKHKFLAQKAFKHGTLGQMKDKLKRFGITM
jgi:hypothetical protein